jgi:RNA polymerase sigma factor (sigma-70 family)
VLPDIQESLDRDRMRQKTQRVLQELPDQYRLVLLWRYWEKASAREMALKTGKTEKAIERLLARARADFRERWNRVSSA